MFSIFLIIPLVVQIIPLGLFDFFLHSHVEVTTLEPIGDFFLVSSLKKIISQFGHAPTLHLVPISLFLVQTSPLCISLDTVQFYSIFHHQFQIQHQNFHQEKIIFQFPPAVHYTILF